MEENERNLKLGKEKKEKSENTIKEGKLYEWVDMG